MTTNIKSIVDNSTLSGAERLLGFSQIRNLSYIDNDIACFEKLINAILFSDKIIAIDDYKDEFRSRRIKNLILLNLKKLKTKNILKHQMKPPNLLTVCCFQLKTANLPELLSHSYEALRLDPQLRWNVFTSSEYLTLTYLISEELSPGYERKPTRFSEAKKLMQNR